MPPLIDTPAVRAEIQGRLSAALAGQVSWQALEVRLLPVPHGELRGLRIEIPGKASVSAELVDVRLRIWPLLRGRTEIASVILRRPRIHVTAGEASKDQPPSDPMAAYRAVVEPLARSLQQFASETRLDVSDAELEVRAPGEAPFVLRLRATGQGGADGLDLELEAANGLWKRLRVEGRLDYRDFSTKLAARLEDLDLAAAIAGGMGTIGSLEGRVSANASALFDTSWRADIELVKSTAALRLPQLPAPVTIAGGAAHLDAAGLRLDKVAVALLDARTLVSGTVSLGKPQVELTATNGVVGETLVRWALERAGAAAQLEPKTPLRFAAQRIAWQPDAGLALAARVEVDAGPRLDIALGLKGERFELKRLAIKDAQSDAVISAVIAEDLFEAGFSGVLHGRSLAALQKKPQSASGSMQGKLQLSIDQARPIRSTAEGALRAEKLDLSALVGRRVLIESVDLATDKTSLRVAQARIDVEEQVFELSGEIRRTGQGPVIEARLESPGVVLDRLLPPASDKKSTGPADESPLWPLPVTGRVAVRAGFVQKGEHKITPFEGTLALEPERARVEVQQARMCGISFPLQAEATPKGYSVAAQIAMQDEPFDKAAQCLTGGRVQITGNADLRAEVRTQGKLDELMRNLTGTAQAELRKGRVEKFALIGNILSVQNLTSIRDPREIDKGFAYRSMTARGHFEGGGFIIEEGFFDSDAARIAVNGRVDLVGAGSQLNVLVGLLSSVDRVTGAIPILGNVLGGTLIALPVSVDGDIRDPRVVPLGRHAVSDRLLGIFERTLKLPGKLVAPSDGQKPATAPEGR